MFVDPYFDGEPIIDGNFGGNDSSDDDMVREPETPYNTNDDDFGIDGEEKPKRIKYYLNNVSVKLINKMVQYLDGDGRLISESLIDYTKKNLKKQFSDLDEFLNRWNKEDRKQAIIDELLEQGIFFDEIKEEIGKDFDEFDLICHLAFNMKPLTKSERINNVKKRNYFIKYGEQAKQVLEILLEKYYTQGIKDIEDINILKLEEFKKIASPLQIVKLFGGKDKYIETIKELEKELYRGA